MEVFLTGGLTIVGLLQVAQIFYINKLGAKLDVKVDESSCKERRGTCGLAHKDKNKTQDHTVEIVERKLDNHFHNGGGTVSYKPYKT